MTLLITSYLFGALVAQTNPEKVDERQYPQSSGNFQQQQQPVQSAPYYPPVSNVGYSQSSLSLPGQQYSAVQSTGYHPPPNLGYNSDSIIVAAAAQTGPQLQHHNNPNNGRPAYAYDNAFPDQVNFGGVDRPNNIYPPHQVPQYVNPARPAVNNIYG